MEGGQRHVRDRLGRVAATYLVPRDLTSHKLGLGGGDGAHRVDVTGVDRLLEIACAHVVCAPSLPSTSTRVISVRHGAAGTVTRLRGGRR